VVIVLRQVGHEDAKSASAASRFHQGIVARMKERHVVLVAGIIFAVCMLFSSPAKKVEPTRTHNAPPSAELISEVASVTFQPIHKPTITMHSRDNCPPCDSWWAVERPRWEAVGWSIDRVTDENTSKLTPWYDIHDGDGQQFEVIGFMTTEKFRKAKEGAK